MRKMDPEKFALNSTNADNVSIQGLQRIQRYVERYVRRWDATGIGERFRSRSWVHKI